MVFSYYDFFSLRHSSDLSLRLRRPQQVSTAGFDLSPIPDAPGSLFRPANPPARLRNVNPGTVKGTAPFPSGLIILHFHFLWVAKIAGFLRMRGGTPGLKKIQYLSLAFTANRVFTLVRKLIMIHKHIIAESSPISRERYRFRRRKCLLCFWWKTI